MICPNCKKEIDAIAGDCLSRETLAIDGNKVVDVIDTEHLERYSYYCLLCNKNIDSELIDDEGF
jgi:hypothetical protein